MKGPAEEEDSRDELELLAPVSLDIVCFRFVGTDPGARGTSDSLDDLNRRLLRTLHLEGTAAPSSTIVDGLLALRVCIPNH